MIDTYLMSLFRRAPDSVYLPEELLIERLVVTDFIAATDSSGSTTAWTNSSAPG